ncbi:ATP-binding protein [Streptomyces sp. A13(2022)]|uniref:ATP-binding protein n=1 Tax=Streptomyces sp. A13(2022) TaxID=2964768 RepID=UPI0021D80661|nr:TniB family NTP-binding protein [Streptomyces sp. A13(2022)]MCU8592150.1 TniB family NTP-binding protein [Streptomyces sp. A13(2022)]
MAAVTAVGPDDFFDDACAPDAVTDWLLWQADVGRPRVTAPPVTDSSWTPRTLLGYHSEFVTLRTPSLERAQAQLKWTLLVNNRQRGTARRGLLISGPPGAGKSTMLTELGRSFELSERRRHARHDGYMPVAFAAIPPSSTPKGLVKELARFACIPVHDRMTETAITDAVCHVLCERRTRLVFIDDVHLLNTRTRPGADTSDQVKTLAERVPATFVLAGVDVDKSPLLTGPRGAQLAARFKMLRTPPLLNGTAEQKALWRALLEAMETALRLTRHRPGTLVRHADYIHLLTGGVMASLSLLIREAAIRSVWDESFAITKKQLAQVVLDVQATNAARATRRRQPGG